MSSAAKTLELLALFSPTRPEIGLSAICRLAGRDKATTYRQLQALEKQGFLEKNPLTKSYRLGPIVLQLAQTREATVPRKAGAEPALSALALKTGETSHVVVLSGRTVYGLAACESPKHSIRVNVDIQTFSLHATASGLCSLAFGPTDLFETAVAEMTAFTPNTILTAQELKLAVQSIQETGFAHSNGSREEDVNSIATPVFDHSGLFAGAVVVASVAARLTPKAERSIKKNLVEASREITKNWGGTIPAALDVMWERSLSEMQTLEAAQ